MAQFENCIRVRARQFEVRRIGGNPAILEQEGRHLEKSSIRPASDRQDACTVLEGEKLCQAVLGWNDAPRVRIVIGGVLEFDVETLRAAHQCSKCADAESEAPEYFAEAHGSEESVAEQ